MLIGGVLLTILVIGGVLLNSRKTKVEKPEGEELLPTEVVIPTIDKSVKVNLISSSPGREVTLQIENIPSGTHTIEYELSYKTKDGALQGVNSTFDVNNGKKDYKKNITLGTCSSGTCIYHQVVGKIRLNLRFTGDYGDKVFEKEYEI